MSRAPSLHPSYAPMRNLQREVHDLCYLALRKCATRAARRERLQEIDDRTSILLPLDGPEIAKRIDLLKADRAYVLEDRWIDRGVIYDGLTNFTLPYRTMAQDLGPYVHQPFQDERP